MSKPVFFLSYAHSDYEAKPKALEKLYKELCDCVAPRTQRAPDEVGFRDSIQLRAGDDWQRKLTEALQQCAVFVPVYSLNYFASEVCGLEWGLFRDRMEQYAKDNHLPEVPAQVVPALWLGETYLEGQIPTTIGNVQYGGEKYPPEFKEVGLEELWRLRRASWGECVSALCNDVVRLYKANPNIPALTPAVTSIYNASNMWAAAGPGDANYGPRFVQFIFVAATKEEIEGAAARKGFANYGKSIYDWRPFLPTANEEAIRLAQRVVLDENLWFQSIDIDNSLRQRVKAANDRHNLVVLVVDTWSLTLPRYSDAARLTSDQTRLNCVVVVPLDPNDAEVAARRDELTQKLKSTFVNRKDELISLDAIRSPDDFRKRLAQALARAKAAIDNTELGPQRDVPPGTELTTISAAQPSPGT